MSSGFFSIELPSGKWLATPFIGIRTKLDKLQFGGQRDGVHIRLRDESSTAIGGLR